MKWTQITITTSFEASEAFSNFFIELGANGVQIDDSSSSTSSQLNASSPVTLITYFPTDDLVGERISKLKGFLKKLRAVGLEVEPAQIEIKSIRDENWAESWKSSFPPQKIAKRFIVSPRWNKIDPTSERIVIWLDPGMAFGTGYHPTTQIALSLLEEVIFGGEQVADIGTGSGILAIAAVKLGASMVIATDIDETVIPIAQENARINGVEDKIRVIQGDAFESLSGRYDVIMANILTEVILPIIPECNQYLKDSGSLIFSGILEEEIPKIDAAAKAHDFKIVKTVSIENWSGFLIQRK